MSKGENPGALKTFEVLVRTNCEYSYRVEVQAANEDAAANKALEEAEKVDISEWSQAWANAEVDHDEIDEVG